MLVHAKASRFLGECLRKLRKNGHFQLQAVKTGLAPSDKSWAFPPANGGGPVVGCRQPDGPRPWDVREAEGPLGKTQASATDRL